VNSDEKKREFVVLLEFVLHDLFRRKYLRFTADKELESNIVERRNGPSGPLAATRQRIPLSAYSS
jgi:hypothetical protein